MALLIGVASTKGDFSQTYWDIVGTALWQTLHNCFFVTYHKNNSGHLRRESSEFDLVKAPGNTKYTQITLWRIRYPGRTK